MRYRKGDKPPGGGGHRTNGPRSLRKGTVRPNGGGRGMSKQWNEASFRQHYYQNPQLQETARRHGLGDESVYGFFCRVYCIFGSDPNPWEGCTCGKDTSHGQVH